MSSVIPTKAPQPDGDDDEGTAVVYSWENVTKKSWENVEEDESGNIVTKNLYNADKVIILFEFTSLSDCLRTMLHGL